MQTTIVNADEAKLLAICFSNYSVALRNFDEGGGASANDGVVVSGMALLAVQRVTGIEMAKPELVEKLIAHIRSEAMAVED